MAAPADGRLLAVLLVLLPAAMTALLALLLLIATPLFALLLRLVLAALLALLLVALLAALLLLVAILLVAVLLHQTLLLYGNIAVEQGRATARPVTDSRVKCASRNGGDRPVPRAAATGCDAHCVDEGVKLRPRGCIDFGIGQRERCHGLASGNVLHRVEHAPRA